MASGSSTQNVNSAQSPSSGVLRDINASLGALDFQPNFLNGLNSSTSSATSTSGAVTLGDRILGGNKSSRQFGLVKILTLIAGAAILLKIYKKTKG